MVASLKMSRDEESQMVQALAEQFPAAKALKMIRLDLGKVQARVDTPGGEVKVDVVVEVTPAG